VHGFSSCSDDGGSTGNKGTGTATVPQEANLAESIVGAGVLTLPAGGCSFGNAPSAVTQPLLTICFIMSYAYGFAPIGRTLQSTGTTHSPRRVECELSARKRGFRSVHHAQNAVCRSGVQYDSTYLSSLAATAGFRVQASDVDCVTGVLSPSVC
jgi:hypothetical protein